MEKKKTLVLGASTNETRYANIAVHRLVAAGHPVEAVGLRPGHIGEVPIQQGQPALSGIHTVTLYLNPDNQKPFYDYILGLKPTRIIFNPGTENSELVRLVKAQGIETENACTLVLLSMEAF